MMTKFLIKLANDAGEINYLCEAGQPVEYDTNKQSVAEAVAEATRNAGDWMESDPNLVITRAWAVFISE